MTQLSAVPDELARGKRLRDLAAFIERMMATHPMPALLPQIEDTVKGMEGVDDGGNGKIEVCEDSTNGETGIEM